ncbi:MAG: type II secretion system major pseudopilin GspG [Acidobacteriota bacterium]
MRKRNEESGFTLIELIVVLVILTMLAALVVPNVFKHLSQSKSQIARLQIAEFEGALQMFAFDVGRYPTNAEGLEALVSNPGNLDAWKGPYLKKTLPMDPWGKPYLYRFPGTHNNEFDLFSYGPDGVEGGEGDNADITNWK